MGRVKPCIILICSYTKSCWEVRKFFDGGKKNNCWNNVYPMTQYKSEILPAVWQMYLLCKSNSSYHLLPMHINNIPDYWIVKLSYSLRDMKYTHKKAEFIRRHVGNSQIVSCSSRDKGTSWRWRQGGGVLLHLSGFYLLWRSPAETEVPEVQKQAGVRWTGALGHCPEGKWEEQGKVQEEI